jgi:hypothetical protein
MNSFENPEFAAKVREIVASAPAPVDAAAIRRKLTGPFAVKPKEQAQFADFVSRIEGLIAWPAANAKSGPRYWISTPEQIAEAKALEAASAGPLAPAKLIAAIAKGKAGYPKAHASALLERLEEEGKLHRQPLLEEKKYKLTAKLTEADITYLRRALQKILRALGETAPPVAATSIDERILDALERIEARKGLVVSAPRLRQAVPGVSKADFDAAVMRLYRAEKVLLHRHSGPHLLSEAEREELVRSQSGGDFYVGVCWNTGEA